jgi:hypothetical protein
MHIMMLIPVIGIGGRHKLQVILLKTPTTGIPQVAGTTGRIIDGPPIIEGSISRV